MSTTEPQVLVDRIDLRMAPPARWRASVRTTANVSVLTTPSRSTVVVTADR